MPSEDALAVMAFACEERYSSLISDGCDEGVAADRTFDALRAALGETEHAYDSRDRLFENQLRTIAAERGWF